MPAQPPPTQPPPTQPPPTEALRTEALPTGAPPADAPPAEPPPAEPLARACASTRAVLARIRPGQLGDPTPCASWDVRALINHFVGTPSWAAAAVATGDGGWRMIPSRAHGQPAAVAYRRGPGGGARQPYGVVMLTATACGITAIRSFADPGLVARFGLPDDGGDPPEMT